MTTVKNIPISAFRSRAAACNAASRGYIKMSDFKSNAAACDAVSKAKVK